MLDYTHRVNARSRSIKLSIDKEGSVIVTTPRLIPKFVVNKFVTAHLGWIETQLAKVAKLKAQFRQAENEVKLFGKTLLVVTQLDKTKPIGVSLKQNQLLVNPVSLSKPSVDKALERFLKTIASTYILKQTTHFAKKMDISYGRVSFKTQKTRWGSCSSQGNLNFNWRLVHAPKEIIDYVIIHELAHRVQINHSAQFWALVAKFDPLHRQHRSWLKKNGMGLN